MAWPVRWLLVAVLTAAAAHAEFPDLTLVLQPDEELDWNQITRWMEQSRFSVDAGSQHHALPPTPSEPSARLRLDQGSTAVQPGLAAGSSVSPAPPLEPGLPDVAPAWRPVVRPGPALLPGASPPPVPAPSAASWRPRWPELRPGPPLVPHPAPALVSRQQAVMRPTFPELQRGEPLLPADAPGAYTPGQDPELEEEQAEQQDQAQYPGQQQESQESQEQESQEWSEQLDGAQLRQLRPLDGQSGPLPTDERDHYQPPPDIDDYDQQPPPAQLNMGPRPPALDGPSAAPPPPSRHGERSVSGYGDRTAASEPTAQALRGTVTRPGPPSEVQPGYQAQWVQHSAEKLPNPSAYQAPKPSAYPVPQPTVPQPTANPIPQASAQTAQQPSGHQFPQPSGHQFPQPSAHSVQHGQPASAQHGQPLAGAVDEWRADELASGRGSGEPAEYPGAAAEYPGARLLAQQRTPASVSGGQTAAVSGVAQPLPLPPSTLAVLLQRLEERLVASEAQQQQHTTQLRAAQHSQMKAEVVAREDMAAIRGEFRDLTTKLDNLQSDLGRMASLLETVTADVQATRRTLRERADPAPSSGSSGGGSPAALEDSVQELDRKLGQLVVNTELLKGGQRRLGANVRVIENRTSELSDRSEQFATKAALASSLTEMRTYLDRQPRPTALPADKEEEALPDDCSDVLLSGETGARSGIYQVRPRHAPQPMFVYCDQETDGGGWAVIQRRTTGDEDFFRDWISYKYGFGNLAGEFWLGNENIHQLTSHKLNELRVDLADFPRQRPGFDDYPGSNATARYGAFALGSETEGYPLKVLDHYSGDAGDSLKYHAGMKFSTKDVDNDLWKEDSCAINHKGGWWYKGCDSSNLNGLYLSGPVPSEYEYQVAYWYDWRGPLYSLYRTQMMVRPADHSQRAAAARSKRAGREAEDGKTAAQRRLGTQTVRGRGRRRRQRRRRGRRLDN